MRGDASWLRLRVLQAPELPDRGPRHRREQAQGRGLPRAGRANAAFAVESLIDDLARELRIRPIELRLQNAVAAGDRATYGPVYDRIGFKETLEAARAHPHYKAPLGPNQGRGVGAGFWFNVGLQSSATVSLNEDGSAVVRTGSPDIGGSRASMAITVAEELGIPVERVRPLVGDTDTVGYCDVTGGSRTTYAGSMAVIEACKQIVEHLRARAATIWDVEIDAVEWKDGFAVGTNGASDRALCARRDRQADGPYGRTDRRERRGQPARRGSGLRRSPLRRRGRSRDRPPRGRPLHGDPGRMGKAVHPTYVEGQLEAAPSGIGMAALGGVPLRRGGPDGEPRLLRLSDAGCLRTCR
ncbi:MAG: molybdopterin cofactor-binding domain-containing protein [Myxococcota bacterium]